MKVLFNSIKKKGKVKVSGRIKKILFTLLIKNPSLGKFVFRVKEVKTKKDREKFDRIWKEVWKEMGYEIEDLSPYDPFSQDFLLRLFGIFPLATLRLIKENNIPLPVFKAFNLKVENTEEKIEATLLAVKKRELFGLPCLLALMKKAYEKLSSQGTKGVFMIIDTRVFRLLKQLGFSLEPLGNPQEYKGSVVVPAFFNFEKSAENLKEKNPSLLRFFVE